MKRYSYTTVILLVTALLLGACPDPSASKPPGPTCSKAYDKCVQPNGVLGLCDPVECKEGEAAPPAVTINQTLARMAFPIVLAALILVGLALALHAILRDENTLQKFRAWRPRA